MKNCINEQENFENIKIKEYIKKYIKELQRHFDLPDEKIRLILLQVYQEIAPMSFFKKMLCMVKSFYKKNIKKEVENEIRKFS